jgi:hypothetical protein
MELMMLVMNSPRRGRRLLCGEHPRIASRQRLVLAGQRGTRGESRTCALGSFGSPGVALQNGIVPAAERGSLNLRHFSLDRHAEVPELALRRSARY